MSGIERTKLDVSHELGQRAPERTIDYPPSTSPDGQLELQIRDGELTVIFPLPPRWTYHLDNIVPLLFGVTAGIGCCLLIEVLWHPLHPHARPSVSAVAMTGQLVRQTLIPLALVCVVCFAAALLELQKYRRWGRVPRVLRASAEGLTISRLGMYRMRYCDVPASEITTIELRPVGGNLNPRRTLATLIIRRVKGRALRFALSTRDPSLPGRIASALAGVLQRSLR